MNLKPVLEKKAATASVPCRIDLGGTLDLSTFFLPLNHMEPSTFNIAMDMRTTVRLLPGATGRVKISSVGFDSAEFDARQAPYDHPMGLMFAVVDFFNVHGVHVHIESTSPPRSALGGSSAAAVAMVAAFQTALEQPVAPADAALLAHHIESGVAGVPCGTQDQLAAAFGGVNRWVWTLSNGVPGYHQRPLFSGSRTAADALERLNRNILVAYCGVPHVSSDVNKRWVNQFLSGRNRDKWEHISQVTVDFCRALAREDYGAAATLMNEETRIRLEMTPDVLDDVGLPLFHAARAEGCGARFTGAGGGGCVWAIGPAGSMERLRPIWHRILENTDQARLLDCAVDPHGIIIH